MNRHHHTEDDGGRRPQQQDDAGARQDAARPDEWQALQRALGNQALQQLLQRQQRQRTRQRALDEAPMLIPPGMQARIEREAGRGRPAGPSERSLVGTGVDDVHIHEGPVAEVLAGDLGARAFTQGKNVFLGPGADDAVTLTHELTHAAEATAFAGSVQRLGVDEEEEEEEVVIVDDDVIDATETMDPFADEPKDNVEVIDETETMDPFKGEKSKDVERIDETETLDPFKEKDGSSKSVDTDARAVGLKADYRTTSGLGEEFSKKVLVPVQEALSFLYGGKGNAQEAYDNLSRALNALYEIATTAKVPEVLSEQMATGFNMLYAIKEMLAPYVGQQAAVEKIQGQLEKASEGMEALMKRLDLAGTLE